MSRLLNVKISRHQGRAHRSEFVLFGKKEAMTIRPSTNALSKRAIPDLYQI